MHATSDLHITLCNEHTCRQPRRLEWQLTAVEKLAARVDRHLTFAPTMPLVTPYSKYTYSVQKSTQSLELLRNQAEI